MIKRTLYFENPAYLSLKNQQLVVKYPDVEKNDSQTDFDKKENIYIKENIKTVPIEDIGVVILAHQQITLTHGLI